MQFAQVKDIVNSVTNEIVGSTDIVTDDLSNIVDIGRTVMGSSGMDNYVKTLANKGLVEGYPDGNFKGDLTMTRYEFAAVIYRALQNGAPIDGNMGRAIEEFNPELERINELDRIRIDRISGKDNDRHKIDRIRINNKDNKDTNEYRDVYGSHIIP